jgi:hypothetical protein
MTTTKYIVNLKVDELKAIAWYYAKLSVGTDKQLSHSIYCGAMKKPILAAHLTNVVGLVQIDMEEVAPMVTQWNRDKTEAEQTLMTLIDSANALRQPPQQDLPLSLRRNKRAQLQPQSEQQEPGAEGHQQQREQVQLPPSSSHQHQQQPDPDLLDQRILAVVENAMLRAAAAQQLQPEYQSRPYRGDGIGAQAEPIIIGDVVNNQQEEDISVAKKRVKLNPSITSAGPFPASSRGAGLSSSHGTVNGMVMDQSHGPASNASASIPSSGTTHINSNIIAHSVPVSVFDSELLPVGQAFIDKCRTGQYNDLTQLLPRKKTRAAAASSSSSEIAFTFDSNGVMKKSTELTEILASSGQKRQIDSFARLAEVMVHTLIGQVYKEDIQSASNMLELFSLAITLERMHGWGVAHHYVEAALDKRFRVPSFSTREIDPALYTAAVNRAGVHYNSYKNHPNTTQTNNSNNSSTSGTSSSPTPIAEQICINYNKYPKCKWGSECRRKHICSICSAPHSALGCPSSPGKGRDRRKGEK